MVRDYQGGRERADENELAGAAYLVVSGFALASGAALGLSIILTEVIRTAMVIADWLDRKYVEPLRRKRTEEDRRREEKVREEGRQEANARWREWNSRRLVAEANGEPFYEPPPGDA